MGEDQLFKGEIHFWIAIVFADLDFLMHFYDFWQLESSIFQKMHCMK